MNGMRRSDDALPPEAVERMRNESLAFRFGLGMMGFGALVVGLPVIWFGTIEPVPASVGVIVIVAGGLLNNPKTFGTIARRLINALPGGKR